MNCSEAQLEIIAYLNGELDDAAKAAFEEHIAGCETCRQELIKAREMLDRMRMASSEAVADLINKIFQSAAKAGASDIHLDPQADTTLTVRYRVDGMLHDEMNIAPELRYGLIDRLKMLAEMNVSQRGLPMDGKASHQIGDQKYGFRIASFPTVLGERMVIRLLDRASNLINLSQLGFQDEDFHTLESILNNPCGLLIVTGPTGCGKTTTEYSILSHIKSPSRQFMTIEDPVEYLIPGVNQAQVNVKEGFTYSSALRAMFRQDPDVMMVGQIRDYDTASLCHQAAISGHFVLAGLFATDALAVFQRFLDMGLDPFMTGNAMIGIVAQRLIRQNCPHCKQETVIDKIHAKLLGLCEDTKVWQGQGCEKCYHAGYKGRTGIFEVLRVDRELGDLISSRVSIEKITEYVKTRGFRSMLDDGRQKVIDGITSPGEVVRILS